MLSETHSPSAPRVASPDVRHEAALASTSGKTNFSTGVPISYKEGLDQPQPGATRAIASSPPRDSKIPRPSYQQHGADRSTISLSRLAGAAQSIDRGLEIKANCDLVSPLAEPALQGSKIPRYGGRHAIPVLSTQLYESPLGLSPTVSGQPIATDVQRVAAHLLTRPLNQKRTRSFENGAELQSYLSEYMRPESQKAISDIQQSVDEPSAKAPTVPHIAAVPKQPEDSPCGGDLKKQISQPSDNSSIVRQRFAPIMKRESASPLERSDGSTKIPRLAMSKNSGDHLSSPHGAAPSSPTSGNNPEKAASSDLKARQESPLTSDIVTLPSRNQKTTLGPPFTPQRTHSLPRTILTRSRNAKNSANAVQPYTRGSSTPASGAEKEPLRRADMGVGASARRTRAGDRVVDLEDPELNSVDWMGKKLGETSSLLDKFETTLEKLEEEVGEEAAEREQDVGGPVGVEADNDEDMELEEVVLVPVRNEDEENGVNASESSTGNGSGNGTEKKKSVLKKKIEKLKKWLEVKDAMCLKGLWGKKKKNVGENSEAVAPGDGVL